MANAALGILGKMAAHPAGAITAGSLLAGGSLLASSLRNPSMPAIGGGRDPEDWERLKEAGGVKGTWGRLKAVTSQGMIKGLTQGGVVGYGVPGHGAIGGGMSAMGSYAMYSMKDTYKAATTLPGIGTGAIVGGGIGMVAGLAAAFATGGKGGGVRNWKLAGLGAAFGALGGAMGVGKVDMAVARTVVNARKNVLSKGRAGRMSNRVKSGGPGYRLWANRTRSAVPMGQPGHLGMNGSMPFAMHNARHRSTV